MQMIEYSPFTSLAKDDIPELPAPVSKRKEVDDEEPMSYQPTRSCPLLVDFVTEQKGVTENGALS